MNFKEILENIDKVRKHQAESAKTLDELEVAIRIEQSKQKNDGRLVLDDLEKIRHDVKTKRWLLIREHLGFNHGWVPRNY